MTKDGDGDMEEVMVTCATTPRSRKWQKGRPKSRCSFIRSSATPTPTW